MFSKHFIFLLVSFCSCLTLLIYFYKCFLCQGQIRPPPGKKSPGYVPDSAGSCLITSVLHCLEKWLKKSVLNALNYPELIFFFFFLVFPLYVFPKNLKRKAARNKFKDKNRWQERIAARFKALILSFCFYKTVAFSRLDRYTHCAKSSNMFWRTWSFFSRQHTALMDGAGLCVRMLVLSGRDGLARGKLASMGQISLHLPIPFSWELETAP